MKINKIPLLALTLAMLTNTFFPVSANGIQNQNEEIVVKGCESFELPGKNNRALLMLHGLGGCPYEVKDLGEYLNTQGFSVVVPRYPGHGAVGKVMSNYSWEDWYKLIESKYKELSKTYDDVSVVGFSTGGTLGLRLAEKESVQRLVLLSPFINLTYKWYYILPPELYVNSVGRLFDDLPSGLTIVNLNDPVARSKYVRGDYFSVKATRSALELIQVVKKEIKSVKSPVLLMHSKGDNTTDYSSSEYIFNNISSTSKKFVTLKKSNHLITLDYEKNIVFEEVNNFLSK